MKKILKAATIATVATLVGCAGTMEKISEGADIGPSGLKMYLEAKFDELPLRGGSKDSIDWEKLAGWNGADQYAVELAGTHDYADLVDQLRLEIMRMKKINGEPMRQNAGSSRRFNKTNGAYFVEMKKAFEEAVPPLNALERIKSMSGALNAPDYELKPAIDMELAAGGGINTRTSKWQARPTDSSRREAQTIISSWKLLNNALQLAGVQAGTTSRGLVVLQRWEINGCFELPTSSVQKEMIDMWRRENNKRPGRPMWSEQRCNAVLTAEQKIARDWNVK